MKVVKVAEDDVLNVREDPDPEAEIIRKLAPGEKCIVARGVRRQVGKRWWLGVEAEPWQAGWVSNRYVETMPEGSCNSE